MKKVLRLAGACGLLCLPAGAGPRVPGDGSRYQVVHDVDLRCYPNYSFQLGDVVGDGRQELICLNQSGNRLRVLDLEGDLILEKQLANHGNWGTVIVCAEDLDGDGRDEIVVPSIGRGGEAAIVAVDAQG